LPGGGPCGAPGGVIGPSIVCWNARFGFGGASGAACGAIPGGGPPGGAPGGGPPGAPGAGGFPAPTPVIIIVPLNFDAAAFGLSGD
jgi:hypothetical protein